MQPSRPAPLPRIGPRLVDALTFASLTFLTLLVGGALLLVAGKLQFASLGAEADPLDVLRAIGMISLAMLGVTIDLDGLRLSVIPLGALILVGAAVAVMARSYAAGERDASRDVPLVGAALGVMSALTAIVSGSGGSAPVGASAPEALVYGFFWGIILTAFVTRGRQQLRAPTFPRFDDRWRDVGVATTAGAWTIAFGSIVALICVIIARLVVDPLPRSFGVGSAAAAIVYLVAFLPNVLIALFALSVGATLQIGAQFDVAGELVGPVRTLSLASWTGSAAAARWILLVLPLGTAIVCGVAASRRAQPVRHVVLVITAAALLLGAGVGILAAIGDARLGAGLVRREGIAEVAVDAPQTALLTGLWIALGGGAAALFERYRRTARRA